MKRRGMAWRGIVRENRSRHKLHISNSMLHKSDSYRLEANLANETDLEGVGMAGETDSKGQ